MISGFPYCHFSVTLHSLYNFSNHLFEVNITLKWLFLIYKFLCIFYKFKLTCRTKFSLLLTTWGQFNSKLEMCPQDTDAPTKSRAITKPIVNESTSETPGAELHMLTNIPIKILDLRSNTFGATCDTTFWNGRKDDKRQSRGHKKTKL